jgi:hypothetical protein
MVTHISRPPTPFYTLVYIAQEKVKKQESERVDSITDIIIIHTILSIL